MFYAICNANGPISKAIDAKTEAEAVEIFEAADTRAWIDEPATDAEDDLEIDGEGMDEDEFQEALEERGARYRSELGWLGGGHVIGGWQLWEVYEG